MMICTIRVRKCIFNVFNSSRCFFSFDFIQSTIMPKKKPVDRQNDMPCLIERVSVGIFTTPAGRGCGIDKCARIESTDVVWMWGTLRY